MANQNVRFFFTDDRRKYDLLTQKDPLALYFIEDAKTGYRALYKGDNLIAVGITASQEAAGLMSAADKRALDNLVANPGGVEFATIDGTITITDGEDGKKNIGVAISQNEGNALTSVGDGLFVPTTGTPNAEQFDIDENGVLTLKDINADKVIYNGEKLSSVLDNATASYTWFELPEVVNADMSNVASTIASVSNGAIVKMSAGTVSDAVVVDKSVTVEGENVGVAQNFSQEV